MGKRRKLKMVARRELSLEEQLAELDASEAPGATVRDIVGSLNVPPAERTAWARKRRALLDAIRQRDAKALADPGPDEGGRYSPTPASTRGHVVEIAPQKLRLSKDSAFPKRIATQRMIDRYFRAGHIDAREWKAADRLWQLWCMAGLESRVTATYSPVTGGGSGQRSAPFEAKSSAAQEYLTAMAAVPYRSRGCVTAVVVCDWSASSWARGRGYRRNDSERVGLVRLRAGIAGLLGFFGY